MLTSTVREVYKAAEACRVGYAVPRPGDEMDPPSWLHDIVVDNVTRALEANAAGQSTVLDPRSARLLPSQVRRVGHGRLENVDSYVCTLLQCDSPVMVGVT